MTYSISALKGESALGSYRISIPSLKPDSSVAAVAMVTAGAERVGFNAVMFQLL